ncbi:DUF4349 domain-containing protein [Motilibacter deserti]|uniref:DUF4349 domain-containing protein n=1 Tax=Motilibacter deserti TaxID=2714956 RepID=A0ABX0GTP4_9ACTN|nr:DUF4349 domain-containing protein [Motilibacter deserti]NHC13900.1 DUF4349 domain-containing protein [Motilibacter deserti]
MDDRAGVRGTALAVLVLGVVGLAGCTANDDDSDSAAANVAAPAPAAAPGAERGAPPQSAADAAAGGSAGVAAPAQPAVLTARALIVSVTRTVRVDDVSDAARRAADLATQRGGRLDGEDGSGDPDDPEHARAVVTLRVPPEQAEQVVRAVEGYGDVLARGRSVSDVTQQVADVDARLANARESVERVRGFYRRAASVRDVVSLERELATRTAELEALEARQTALRDSTTYSTVTVTFVGRAVSEGDGDEGFGAGLSGGWKALTASVAVLLTVLGAVLPFLPVLALLGLAAWYARRVASRAAERRGRAATVPE